MCAVIDRPDEDTRYFDAIKHHQHLSMFYDYGLIELIKISLVNLLIAPPPSYLSHSFAVFNSINLIELPRPLRKFSVEINNDNNYYRNVEHPFRFSVMSDSSTNLIQDEST